MHIYIAFKKYNSKTEAAEITQWNQLILASILSMEHNVHSLQHQIKSNLEGYNLIVVG